jgi:hypothetical protein
MGVGFRGVSERFTVWFLQPSSIVLMRKSSLFLIVIVLGVLAGGAVFLATWEIPPPTVKVEKVLSDEQFPR